MGDIEHQSEAVRYVAQNTEFTTGDVDSILHDLEYCLQGKLVTLYETAWSKGRKQNFITHFADTVCFANSEQGWWHDYVSDSTLSKSEFSAALMYHQYFARNILGFLVETKTSKQEPFLPIFIELPDSWADAGTVAGYYFEYYFQFGLTPAEALDHWLCQRQGWEARTVAAWRDVGAEAVQKNLRQAQEKLGDYSNAEVFYEEKGARKLPIREAGEEYELPEPDSKPSDLKSVENS